MVVLGSGLQLVKLAVLGPVNVLAASAQWAWEGLRLLWGLAAALGAAAVAAWRAATAGVRLAPAVQQGAQDLGGQARISQPSCAVYFSWCVDPRP
jgi:hypothetical protein